MSNVPKLRFKEFSGEWEEKALGSVSKQISYGLTVRPDYIETGIPLISARELRSGSIDYNIAPRISEDSYNKLSEKAKAKKGDIFLTKTGTVGLSAYVHEDFPIAITQNIAVIRVLNGGYNHQFILQTFKTQSFYRTAISKVNQSTIMDLQLQDIRKLLVSFPSKPEQEKIASFLTSVDTKIELLVRKEELLQQYKKGVMQKIFSQEIRFKADDGSEYPEWEEKKLEDISTAYYQGINTTADKLEYYKDGFPILQAKHITNEIIDMNDVRFVDLDTYNSYKNKFQPKVNDLLISNIGTLGKIVLVEESFDFLIAWNIFKVTLKTNVDSKFIMFALKKITQEGYFERMQTGNATKFVNKGDMLAIKCELPCLKEQAKIANFLSSIDSKIEHIQKQLNSTKAFKKALLQQMFV